MCVRKQEWKKLQYTKFFLLVSRLNLRVFYSKKLCVCRKFARTSLAECVFLEMCTHLDFIGQSASNKIDIASCKCV